tara:strand:- start:902 stop:2056 length:1155 start_codon:yes stop_codon:yes gene_type:complete
MSLSNNTTYRVFLEKLGNTLPNQFVGNAGEMFYDPSGTVVRFSDGITPGGIFASASGQQWLGNSLGIHTLSSVGIATSILLSGVDLTVQDSIGFGNADGNISIGDSTTGATLTSSSSSNIVIGHGAGAAFTNGDDNIFIGYKAGALNTGGDKNVFVGNWGGYYTTGDKNSFFGYAGGYTNTSGESNSFFGHESGYDNTTGSSNTFLGTKSGNENTTGSYNTYVGAYCGEDTDEGSRNTCVGSYAGTRNKSGNLNTVVGGYCAGYSFDGSNNIFIGSNNGDVDASHRIVIGNGFAYNDLFDAPNTKNNQLAVGLKTDANPAKYWLVGDENYNIGINSTAPTRKLDVAGDVKVGVNTSQGVILTSPNGTEYRLTVDNSGTLTAVTV